MAPWVLWRRLYGSQVRASRAPEAEEPLPDLPTIGHNGGPALDDVDGIDPSGHKVSLHLGEKFLALFERARHKAFFGGRGSAKSHSVATYLVIVSSQRNVRIVCCRQFQNSLRDSSKELIDQKIRSLGLLDQFSITEREIIHRKTGSRFTFIGLDRNPTAMKSLEGCDIAWVEEASSINRTSFEILIPTIRKPGSQIIWTWNPDKQDDPVDAYFRSEIKPPDSIIVRVGFEDNPWFFQTEMPNEMWFMQQGNHERYKHIWLGEYDTTFEGRIFTNVEFGYYDVPEYVAPRYGLDFGFGTDPSSIVKVYPDLDNGVIYVEREITGSVPLRQLPAAIDQVIESNGDWIVADSAQPGAIDHLRSVGYNITGAVKAQGSIKTGINWLKGFRIIISPECPNLTKEARLYTWQVDRRTKQVLSVPVDAHNHSWDAVRYATESLQTVAPGSRGAVKMSL